LFKKRKREDAMQFLRLGVGCSLMEAFESEPLELHREYVRKLVEIGAVEDIVG
jgi:hypothetical protein